MINLSQFAERLNELIFDNKTNVNEVAKAVGVHQSAIYRYLRAERMPSIEIVIKIASYFQCSVDFLLGLTEQSYSTKFVICPPFKDRLSFLLKHFDVKKSKLIMDTGISVSIFYSWQGGYSIPNLESIIKLAKYFDCSVDYLLGID